MTRYKYVLKGSTAGKIRFVHKGNITWVRALHPELGYVDARDELDGFLIVNEWLEAGRPKPQRSFETMWRAKEQKK